MVEIVNNGIWIMDDLTGVNIVKELNMAYLSIEHENEMELGIYMTKKDFEYFKERINEIEFPDLDEENEENYQ